MGQSIEPYTDQIQKNKEGNIAKVLEIFKNYCGNILFLSNDIWNENIDIQIEGSGSFDNIFFRFTR